MKNSLIYLTCVVVAVLFASCHDNKDVPILLFTGTGTSPNDVEAIEGILLTNQLEFTRVNSSELNELDTLQLKRYKLIIIPGGNFIDMGKSLTTETTGNIQSAVYGGLNYLGICAGGFLAGDTKNNSFNFFEGAQFRFYADEDKGIRKEAVAVANADGTTIEHYWEDGPQFSTWGDVVSTYPDGTPATVEGSYGSGWIVLTGVHPEAPERWRNEFHFSTSQEESHEYASRLIKSALEKKEMSHF